MPVIQLPKDTRWGDLGTGLGQVIGGALEGYANKQADQSVAQIMEDPLLTEPAKLTKIMKEVPNGLERYKGLVTTQVLSATVKEKQAEALKNTIAAGLQQSRTNNMNEVLGVPTPSPQGALPTSTAPPTGAPSVASVLGGGGTTAPTPAAPTASTGDVGAVLSGTPASTTPAPAPATTAPTAPTTSTPAATGLGAKISQLIDTRASALGVTVTPAEKQSLIPDIAAHVGAGTSFGPTIDAFLKEKQNTAKLAIELPTMQSKREEAALSADAAKEVAANAKAQAAAQRPLAEIDANAKSAMLVAQANHAQQTTMQGMPVDMSSADIKAAYPSLTQEQAQTLVQVGKVQGGAEFNKTLQSFVKENTEASRKQTPQIVQDVAAMLPAIQSYHATLDQIEKYPNMQGGPVSGVLAPLLQKYGFDGIMGFFKSNPEVLQQLTTSEQLTLQTVEGHHGMGGQFLVPLVSATMPSAAKSKLFSAVETNVKAEDYLAKLGSLRAAYQAGGIDTRQLDEATTAAQKLYDRSSSLWWTGPTADNPNAVSRVFYGGREINPATFQPVQGGSREFAPQDFVKLGENMSVTGAQLNAAARREGKTPEEILAIMKSQVPGMPR